MKLLKTVTLNNPVSLGRKFTFYPANLQQGFLYHNTKGLVGIIVLHTKKIFIHSKLTVGLSEELEDATELLRKTAFSPMDFEVNRIDLRKVDNYVSLSASRVPNHIAS